jgi:hypothetical protein
MGIYWVVHNAKFLDSTKAASIMWETLAALKNYHHDWGWYIPIGSMYGIFANIWGILMVNVTIYGIHRSYGI